MISDDASIPVLAAWMPMSSATASICPVMMSSGISWKPLTPTEFCTVTAATATQPCTPSIAKVRRSAWMPAPPPESDPAIVITRSGVWPGGVSGR